MPDKLYLVTRKNLPPGPQAVQICHVARIFQNEHPEVERKWFVESNYLAVLSTEDEESLVRLIKKADKGGVLYSVFREPDLGNHVTAVAFEPGVKGRRICSGLGLALTE